MIVYITEFHGYAVRDRPEIPDHGHILPLEVVVVHARKREDQWPMLAGYQRFDLEEAKEAADRYEQQEGA